MAKKAGLVCSDCGQSLGPQDETCPECGALTPLGLERERATRREAGLEGVRHILPSAVSIAVLLILAAAIVYGLLHEAEIRAVFEGVRALFQPG